MDRYGGSVAPPALQVFLPDGSTPPPPAVIISSATTPAVESTAASGKAPDPDQEDSVAHGVPMAPNVPPVPEQPPVATAPQVNMNESMADLFDLDSVPTPESAPAEYPAPATPSREAPGLEMSAVEPAPEDLAAVPAAPVTEEATPASAGGVDDSVLNFYELDSMSSGAGLDEVDFSSLSSSGLNQDDGASFYDLDSLTASAPGGGSGGESVYDLDSLFGGSSDGAAGPVSGPAAAPTAPSALTSEGDLVDFSALSQDDPSSYDLDALTLSGASDPFASLVSDNQPAPSGGPPGIGPAEIVEIENELRKASLSQPGPVQSPPAGTTCLVVYHENRAVYYFPLGREEVFLGKDEEGDNTFPGFDLTRFDSKAAVASLHASVVCEGDRYFIQDIQGSTGTKVNGTLLPPDQKVPLKDGDSLLLGEAILLRFEVMK